MTDDLVHIDTDVLDQLIEANRQRQVLDDFRVRAEQMKEKVDEAVYRRVFDDYTTRQQALESGTEPLRTRARVEYEKLSAAYGRLEQVQDRARLEKQELEFRHQIGELDTAQATDRLAAPTQALEDCRVSLARLDAQKLQFVEAFESEESLLGLATRRVVVGQTAGDRRTPAPRATVHVEGEAVEVVDYALGAVARIGRAEDNDICIQSRGMSRHHAVISATAEGFLLRDLGSQNGTVISGERVAERQLADGDVIAMGDARLRFEVVGASKTATMPRPAGPPGR